MAHESRESGPVPGVPDFSQLAMAATATHEMFTAYIGAGFTEDQAIKLVLGLITQQRPA